jgi:hypothetical protein
MNTHKLLPLYHFLPLTGNTFAGKGYTFQYGSEISFAENRNQLLHPIGNSTELQLIFSRTSAFLHIAFLSTFQLSAGFGLYPIFTLDKYNTRCRESKISYLFLTSNLGSNISCILYFTPSLPKPESFTPPYGI